MEKLAENYLNYFYLRHVVIVVTTAVTMSSPPVNNKIMRIKWVFWRQLLISSL